MLNITLKKNIDKGYSFIEILGNVNDSLELKRFVQRNGIFHIVIGEDITDLKFLSEIVDYVKILISLKSPKCDFSLVGDLVNLEHLYIADLKSSSLNLSNLRKLKYLSVKFNKKLIGFEALKELNHLELKSYPYHDMSLITLPENLEKFEIISSRIETFETSKLPKRIKSIGFYLCSNLKKITFHQTTEILNLVIENCKELVYLNNIRDLNKLEYLIIENCPSIFSLDELMYLKSLKHVALCGSTTISIGDLDFLKGIKYFHWDRKRAKSK